MEKKKGLSICFFSDSHGFHDEFELPEVDIAICAGDMTLRGKKKEVESFFAWYQRQPAKHKITIAGNHDYWFDVSHKKSECYGQDKSIALSIVPDDIIYLQDSMIEIEGVKIWGSPVTPWFHNWAFNMMPEDLVDYWKIIPDEADIVVTHGPPANTKLDLCRTGHRAGCPSLMHRLLDIRPKIHAFGHIHEGQGMDDWNIPDDEGNEKIIRLINCSVVNLQYYVVHKPFVIDWDEQLEIHENNKDESGEPD